MISFCVILIFFLSACQGDTEKNKELSSGIKAVKAVTAAESAAANAAKEIIAKEIEEARLAAEKAASKAGIDTSKLSELTYPGHWLEIDISEQTAYLRDGDKRVQSFLVSTGTPDWPTDIGVFKVWAKRSEQDISGADYRYPGTKWLTYYNGGEAFHTAYWHENFGTPMSHGCANMREADAKAVYDWAKIGTVVVVHS
jgi:lipoprotein-anchoring transpeptidase ErfK/SrfK